MIERFKEIARAASRLTGREITEETARGWARRARDPLPVSYLAGRPGIEEVALVAWLGRQDGARRGAADPGRLI
jgi:hypothetical protein